MARRHRSWSKLWNLDSPGCRSPYSHYFLSPRIPKILAAVLLIFGFVYAITLSSSSVWTYWERKREPNFSNPQSSSIGISLHPQEHIWRKPRTTRLVWAVSSGVRSPDGVEKAVFLVNDQFPGPTIEARSGDELIVQVQNNLEGDGVSIHWHGLRMLDQNLMDGAVGVTQCPIPPGGNFTYHFTIGEDEHGTFWWHSHAGGQRSDGLFGGLIVHQPQSQPSSLALPYDEEMLLMVGDWFHASAADTLTWYRGYEHFGAEPVPDSILINGRGRFNCSMAVPARPLNCTEVARTAMAINSSGIPRRSRWRVINTGSISGISLSMTGAAFTPIEVDGGHGVAPISGSGIGVLHPGERVDILVTAETISQGATFIVSLDDENFRYMNPTLQSSQSFPMTHDTDSGDHVTAQSLQMVDVVNLSNLTAIESVPATHWPTKASQILVVYAKVNILSKFNNMPKGYMNHSSWEPQLPPLLSLNRTFWDENQFVPFIEAAESTNQSQWVDLVINNLDDGSHPFHLHGHSFYVLSTFKSDVRDGWGSYNPSEDASSPGDINIANPVQKDTVIVPRRGHVIIRFLADNPGLWMLHCHMSVHLGSGISMVLHIGSPEDKGHLHSSRPEAASLCLEQSQ